MNAEGGDQIGQPCREVLAGHEAATRIYRGHADVHVLSCDPLAHSFPFPSPYSVRLVCLPAGITVCGYGTGGLDGEERVQVGYPCPVGAAAFETELRRVLVPVVTAQLARLVELRVNDSSP